MSKRTKVFTIRLSPEEQAYFTAKAKSLGMSKAELIRFLMHADIAKVSMGTDSASREEKALVVRFVEDDSFELLTRQIRRIGVLLNQATRALNDLRRRKGMSANYVAERLNPIAEKVFAYSERFDHFESDWNRVKLSLLGEDLIVMKSIRGDENDSNA